MKPLALFAALCIGLLSLAAGAAVKNDAPAPNFKAVDALSGKDFSLEDHKGKIVVLEWVNYSCPFVKKFYQNGDMQRLQQQAKEEGVVWVSINSGAPGKQGHFENDAAALAAFTAQKGAASHYLRDESGKIGRAYGAKTTPHMYVINQQGILTYQGAIDNTPSVNSGDIASATNYVTAALAATKAGKTPTPNRTRAYGCVVKY